MSYNQFICVSPIENYRVRVMRRLLSGIRGTWEVKMGCLLLLTRFLAGVVQGLMGSTELSPWPKVTHVQTSVAAQAHTFSTPLDVSEIQIDPRKSWRFATLCQKTFATYDFQLMQRWLVFCQPSPFPSFSVTEFLNVSWEGRCLEQRLHFPASFAAECSHVTMFWPIECEQKGCRQLLGSWPSR